MPALGTTADTAAYGNHTHTLSMTAGGTSTLSLTPNTVYTLTAGGNSLVFTTPDLVATKVDGANVVTTTYYADKIVASGGLTPTVSGGAVYTYPFDEGTGVYTLATREWTTS